MTHSKRVKKGIKNDIFVDLNFYIYIFIPANTL